MFVVGSRGKSGFEGHHFEAKDQKNIRSIRSGFVTKRPSVLLRISYAYGLLTSLDFNLAIAFNVGSE
jgi:hypothetical protein